MSEDDEIVEAFLEESRENLAQLDEDLVALEARPDDPELLARIFRVIHTIKGTCGFLGYVHLEELTHAGETLLGSLRDGTLRLDAEITTSLLRLVDAVRVVLERIDADGQEGDVGHAALIAELQAHVGPGRAEVAVAAPREEPEPEATMASESSVRVDVAALDRLMDLVGELVLARTRLTGGDDGDLGAPERQLRTVTEELHAAVMQARLQPIGNALGRLRRIVRDLGAALGKQVRLELDGEDVGVDKAVNEALRDPLLHLVRNAVDHGIEAPADRVAAGKPAEGVLRIRAFHASGMVQVEVQDDGRGVDPARLVAHAVAAGALTEAEAAQLGRRQALDLMFLPGLSTNDSITNVSGRGVGMDVVRANVQQVGGSVEVRSEPGMGTTFRLTVPLTLGIMPILTVTSGGQRYAVPTAHVHEVVSLDSADEDAGVLDELDGVRLFRLRGRLLPLAEMAQLFGTADEPGRVMVVVEVDGTRFGLVVDAVGDPSDIVVKPLTDATSGIPYFSAVTILDDGRPTLILDLAGIAAGAGIERGAGSEAAEDEAAEVHGDDLLVAVADGGGRLVVRLQDVTRLEEVDPATVERAGEVDVVQYRDALLPLIRVSELLPERRSQPRAASTDPASDRLRTIVCRTSVGSVGFVVADVADIVPHPHIPLQPATRAGVEACVVVDGHVAEILDLEALVARAGLRARHG